MLEKNVFLHIYHFCNYNMGNIYDFVTFESAVLPRGVQFAIFVFVIICFIAIIIVNQCVGYFGRLSNTPIYMDDRTANVRARAEAARRRSFTIPLVSAPRHEEKEEEEEEYEEKIEEEEDAYEEEKDKEEEEEDKDYLWDIIDYGYEKSDDLSNISDTNYSAEESINMEDHLTD